MKPKPYSEEWWMRHDIKFYLRRAIQSFDVTQEET